MWDEWISERTKKAVCFQWLAGCEEEEGCFQFRYQLDPKNWNMHLEMVFLRLDLFEAAFSRSLAKKKRVDCKLQEAKRSLQLAASCKQQHQKKLQAAPAPRAANVPPVDPRGWPRYQLEKCLELISILLTKLMSLKAACCKPNKNV